VTKKAAGISKKQAMPVGRPFQPGVSGNPSGRPKGQLTLVKELLALGPKAILNLKSALERDERWATEQVISAFAIKELIAAALLEKDELPGDFDWSQVDDAEVAKVISIARKAQAKAK